jgi:hypothetical protein
LRSRAIRSRAIARFSFAAGSGQSIPAPGQNSHRIFFCLLRHFPVYMELNS